MAKKPVSYLAGAVLLGTAIGSVVGLLSAPRSGRDTREDLKKKAGDAGRQINDVGRRLPERLSSMQARGREVLDRLPQALRRKKADSTTPDISEDDIIDAQAETLTDGPTGPSAP